MHDFLHRLARVLLLAVGAATLADAAAHFAADLPAALQHRAALLAITGAALLAAPWWPPLRVPALAAALLAKLAFLALALATAAGTFAPAAIAGEALQTLLLAAAGAILAREARQEARWNMRWRQEG